MRSPKAVAIIIGLFILTTAGFYAVGHATRPMEDWSGQYINRSTDPLEFSNAFHGIVLRAPEQGKWLLAWEPATFRFPNPPGVNKVLEIERILPTDGSDTQWARMDLFVQPVPRGTSAARVLRKLEFRRMRRGFCTVQEGQEAVIGGEAGGIRVGQWAVGPTAFRSVAYHVLHDGKLFALIGVTQADASERFRPVFRAIAMDMRFD